MISADKIKEQIAKQLDKKIEEVTEEKELVKDLGADSLDSVEMIMNLEDEFNITIPEDEISNIKTVGDVIKLVANK
ncbi:MAG: acyl carrier protein [Clostridia bacterium]|nr:acyl carrier protein [Clostridia bacterium]